MKVLLEQNLVSHVCVCVCVCVCAAQTRIALAVGIVMLMLLSTAPLSAQGDISQYQSSCAEVAFVTGTIDQSLSAYTPTVTMNLAGPVFNNVGVYAPEATTAIITNYSMGRDLTYGVVNMRTTQDQDVGWEGLLPMNCQYSVQSGRTPGHIGWGEYKFTVAIAGAEKSFYLSTLDGNWLSSALGEENKIVFYVDFHKETDDPPEIDIQVWQYSIQDWRSVAEDERVTFWELHDAERERDKIVALSDLPFIIGADGPIDVPFVNDQHDFDINVIVENRISIRSGKTVTITDFKSRVNNNVAYHNSKWKFVFGSGIDVYGGNLVTYSHDPQINNLGVQRWAVQFLSLEEVPGDPRKRWGGISTNSNATLNIRDALIAHAASGISVFESEVLLRRTLIDSCHFGIQSYSGTLIAERDTVKRCWVGVHVLGDGFSPVGDRVVLDSCQIWNNTSHGVLLGRKYPAASTTVFNSIKPEESVLIRRTEIKHNGGHGVASIGVMAGIRECNISKNGWLWGTPFASLSPNYQGYSGIYTDFLSTFNIHGSDFQSNVGDGIYTRNSTMSAWAFETEYDGADIRGWNCFDGNRVSVMCDRDSYVHFGKRLTADYYIQDLNALRYPRWKNPVDQQYINLHVRNASWVEFEHNYWLPSTDGILIEGTLNFTAKYFVKNPDSVRCGTGASPGGNTLEIPGSQTASTLVRLVKSDSLSAAWDHIKANLSDNFGDHDARVFTWALQTLRLTAAVDSAQLLLENEAFNPDAGTVSALDLHALLNLRGIYFILGDTQAAWRTYDSLYARLPFAEVEHDTLEVEMYRARILWYLEQDTTAAESLITDLYASYPSNINVSTMYVDITGDTTALWFGAFDEMEKSPASQISESCPTGIEILGCYPNPFNPSTTINFSISNTATITLRLYAMDGRLVDVRPLGTREAGRHSYEYTAGDLPSGTYLCDVTDGVTSASFRLLLNK